MSTPMFIREPILGSAIVPGQALGGGYSGATATELVAAVTEATLIEEIAWATREFSTLGGELCLVAMDGGGLLYVVGHYALDAGTASLCAAGRIEVNLVLPVGWSLRAGHNIDNGGGLTDVVISALGGIIR